jgi:hypothetical protein
LNLLGIFLKFYKIAISIPGVSQPIIFNKER